MSALPPLPPGMVFVGEQSLREHMEELDAMRASLKAETARADAAEKRAVAVMAELAMLEPWEEPPAVFA